MLQRNVVGYCLIFWILIVLLLTSACSDNKILVGFAGQLTGSYSDLGVQGRNGATLAVEEINAQGGIAGKNLELLARDDGNKPAKARQVDRELIQKGVVAIIGHMTSSQSMAALPVVQEAGVVLLSPTTSTPRLSAKKDMFFRVQASSSLSAQALGHFATKELNLDLVSTLWDKGNLEYTKPFTENFMQSFSKAEGEIVRECPFLSSETDGWSRIIDCLKLDKAQGVMIAASARDTAAFVQAVKKKSPECKVLSSGWAATPSLLVQGGDTVEGVYVAIPGFVDRDAGKYREFVKKYKARFGKEPSFAAVQGYHSVKVLAGALERTGGTRKGLPEALVRTKGFQSFYGELSLNKYGDAFFPMSIVKVRNGSFTRISRIEVKK